MIIIYDFTFDTKEQIKENPEEFLLFCKRLLPRWVNGIPDSECLALYRTISLLNKKNPILVETGCGASTLALFLYAAIHGGLVYSWDTNGSRGAFMRSVVSDAICRVLGVDLHKIWTFIAFDSTNSHVGIKVLSELSLKADLGFFDSWHTLDHLKKEIGAFEEIANNEFIIALDDAYYEKKYENYSFINMIRKKIGLSPVAEPTDNHCRPFYIEVKDYLSSKYKVEDVDNTYHYEYQSDLFFAYYDGDRNFMDSMGMEERDKLAHRFEAFKVKKE